MAKRRREWDVVYFDPPYDSNYDEVLNYFSTGAVIKPKGTLVIEHHAEMFFPRNFRRNASLARTDSRRNRVELLREKVTFESKV
jgi:16S rRNA G966 N2-methylase RsmD